MLPQDAAWGHMPCGQVGPSVPTPAPEVLSTQRTVVMGKSISDLSLPPHQLEGVGGSGLADLFLPGVFFWNWGHSI